MKRPSSLHFVGVFWSAHYGVGIKSRGCGRVKHEESFPPTFSFCKNTFCLYSSCISSTFVCIASKFSHSFSSSSSSPYLYCSSSSPSSPYAPPPTPLFISPFCDVWRRWSRPRRQKCFEKLFHYSFANLLSSSFNLIVGW